MRKFFSRWVLMMLVTSGIGVGCAIVVPGGGNAEAAAGTPRILLENVRVFDVSTGRMSEPQSILIMGTRISAVGHIQDPGKKVQRIDCAGKFAVPGLFDCHTHLIELTAKGDDGLKAGLAEFVSRGVTQVRDVGGPIDVLSRTSRRIAEGELTGPEIFYTGPMLEHTPLTWGHLNKQFPGFTVALDSNADVDSVLPELGRKGATIIKTFNNIDPGVYRHIVEVAKRCGLKIVHDPGAPLFHWIPMDQALDLGVTSIEHAKSPWPVVLKDPLKQEHDRLVGPGANQMAQMAFLMKAAGLGVASVSEDRLKKLAEKMNEKGAFLCATLQVLTSNSMEKEAIEETKRQMKVDTLPAPVLEMIRKVVDGMKAVSRHFVREFAGYGVKMLVGQDGCDAAATFSEMRTLKEGGVRESEIIKGATIYPAQWLGVDDRLGSIAPGKQANILVVNGDPLSDIAQLEATFMVIRNGKPVSR
ncbi:MAG: amidohydrolase family protein [Candidatus Aminicenantales bacterium]